MFGPVLLTARRKSGLAPAIRHLVLDGSSQWVVGRNVTSRANILQLDGSCIELPGPHRGRVRLLLHEDKFHLYLDSSLFYQNSLAGCGLVGGGSGTPLHYTR